MRWLDRLDVNYPTLLLAGLTVAVVATATFGAATSSASYGPYNPRWDGTTDLRAQASAVGSEFVVGTDVARYDDAPAGETVAVVLSPDDAYSAEDANRLRRFLQRGGTLLVADDFGTAGNRLLAALNASSRFDGRVLRDERRNYRSPPMAVVPNFADHPLVSGIEPVVLNYGTPVRPGNATVLANTSEFAYLDVNGNRELDRSESLDSYSVATVESVGDGRLVVVGDSSAFVNAMLDRPGNRQFARRLFAGNERVLLDYSHGGTLPPLVVALRFVRATPVVQAALGTLLVGTVLLWVEYPGIPAKVSQRFTRGEPRSEQTIGDERLLEAVARRYPDSERERVRRVANRIIDEYGEGDDD